MATDYEKKYKEALERAKRLTSDMTTLQKIREFIFPELAESEDEKIRKAIIHYVLYKANGVSEEQEHEWVAYLEKQKEQKKSLSERFRPDFPAVADFIESVDDMEKNKAIGILEDYLKWAVSSEEECRYTWKELANAIQLGINAMKEQKPSEWSEEDEKDMAHIIRILDDCYVYGTHDLSKTDHENLVNKLKSLRPSWKPSEEELAKKHLDGYCMGREDTLREMKDFVESHFNCENAKKGMPIVYNTQSGTSTLKAEG